MICSKVTPGREPESENIGLVVLLCRKIPVATFTALLLYLMGLVFKHSIGRRTTIYLIVSLILDSFRMRIFEICNYLMGDDIY